MTADAPLALDPSNLLWVDLEMTGLDTVNDHIIEIALVATDARLETIHKGPSLVIHQPDEVLAGMDKWNTSHHARSGLTDEVRASRIDCREAEAAALAFAKTCVEAGKSPMCGNSICQDRRFLARLMPELERFFHYRNLDVSTLKELAQRWKPEAEFVAKDSAHRAQADILESIEELRAYKAALFGL